MGSADWMPRNLDRRVEIMFPVENEKLMEQIRHVMRTQLSDNTKAHILQSNGKYEKVDKRGKKLVNSQEQFCQEARKALPPKMNVYQERVFIPAEPVE